MPFERKELFYAHRYWIKYENYCTYMPSNLHGYTNVSYTVVKSGLKYLINDYIDSGSRPFSRRLQYLLQQLEAIYNKMVKKLQRLCELMRPPYKDLNASLEK